jgi:hypothetical protein
VANASDVEAASATFTDAIDWVLDSFRVENGTHAPGSAPPRRRKKK